MCAFFQLIIYRTIFDAELTVQTPDSGPPSSLADGPKVNHQRYDIHFAGSHEFVIFQKWHLQEEGSTTHPTAT